MEHLKIMFQYFVIILVLIGTSHSEDPEMNEMVLTEVDDDNQHAFSPPYAVPFEFDTENNTFNDTYQRKIYDAIDFINNNLCGCILLRYYTIFF